MSATAAAPCLHRPRASPQARAGQGRAAPGTARWALSPGQFHEEELYKRDTRACCLHPEEMGTVGRTVLEGSVGGTGELELGHIPDRGKTLKASVLGQSGGWGQREQDEVRVRQGSDPVRSYRSE